MGPRTGFTNDLYPKAVGKWKIYLTQVHEGASIGSGVTVICGITIGANARVGAGAVVTKNVPENSVVVGVPAKHSKEIKWEQKN